MKKKILAITLCVAMLAIVMVSGTLAYFTDEHVQTNTFTAGKVDITLDEAVVVLDEIPESDTFGDLIAKNENARTSEKQEYTLFPGMNVTKDPTITVAEKSEDAYVAAVITVKFPNADLDLMKTMGLIHPTHENMLMVGGLLKGGNYVGTITPKEHPLSGKNNMLVYGPEEYSIYQIPKSTDETWTVYMFFEEAKTAGEEIMLFEQIMIPATWNNNEMATVNGMNIDVAAYAVQAHGFADCYTAMITAFPSAFPFA